MSQADAETLRVILEAISRGDWDGAIPHIHPDFERSSCSHESAFDPRAAPQ
jgi:hypothetical protein